MCVFFLVVVLDILHQAATFWATVQDHPFVPSVLLGPAKPENVSTAQYRNSPLDLPFQGETEKDIKGARGITLR